MNTIDPSGETTSRHLSAWHCIAGFAQRESVVLDAAADGMWLKAETLYFEAIDEIHEKHGVISEQMATAYDNLALLLEPQSKDATTYRGLSAIIRRRLAARG